MYSSCSSLDSSVVWLLFIRLQLCWKTAYDIIILAPDSQIGDHGYIYKYTHKRAHTCTHAYAIISHFFSRYLIQPLITVYFKGKLELNTNRYIDFPLFGWSEDWSVDVNKKEIEHFRYDPTTYETRDDFRIMAKSSIFSPLCKRLIRTKTPEVPPNLVQCYLTWP